MKLLFFTFLTFFIINVFANTEKIILEARSRLVQERCNSKNNEPVMIPPYTKLQQSISPISRSVKNPHQLFYLRGLDDGSSYEIRVSYPAITPADFVMSILSSCRSTDDKLAYILSVSTTYTGVSQVPRMETAPIVYDLVLETLYFGFLYYEVYKVVLAIIGMLLFGQFVVIPKVKELIIKKTKTT